MPVPETDPRADLSGIQPIVALAPNAWDGQWMNRQQLLSRLAARGARIVYSTGQWFTWQRHTAEWRAAPWRGGFSVMNGVLVDKPGRGLLRIPALPALDRLSMRLAVSRWLRALACPSPEACVVYVFHPRYQPYAALMPGASVVYHAYDLHELMPGWNEEVRAREDWLLQRAELVVASSEPTAERLRERSGREVRVLPNGADCEAFANALNNESEPAEYAGIPRPRIGYVGSLNRKIDFDLLADIATARPDWHIVLVGPEGSLDRVTAEGLERCRASANVHHLGSRPPDELPAFVAGFDVALMPYRTGEGLWTSAISPLKLHEYLAAGKAVVSTRLPSLEAFSEVLSFPDEPQAWVSVIEQALATGGTDLDRRQSIARAYDWDRLADVLNRWLIECGHHG